MKSFLLRSFSALGCALATVLFLAPTATLADGTFREHVRLAGTFLTSRMDGNSDGLPASWCTVEIKGGMQGRSTQQCINEDVFAGFTPECPGGLLVVNDELGGTGVGTRTFPNAVDQIYIRLTERELCISEFGQASGIDSGVIVGGAGHFAGVTGTYELEYIGQVQYFDPAAVPPQQFGSIAGSAMWEIQFPN